VADRPDQLAETIRRVIREEMRRSRAVRDLALELARLVLDEAEASAPESHASAEAGASARDAGEPSSDRGAPRPIEPADSGGRGSAQPGEPSERTVVASVPLNLDGIGVDIEVTGSEADVAGLRRSAAEAEAAAEPGQEAPRPKPIDLGVIEERARLKAESCRFFIERRRDRGDPVREPALKERMDEMLATAKSMQDCFLWVFWKHEEQPPDGDLLKIAACYDALADASVLCIRAVSSDGRLSETEMQEAFQLLAEASSALRVALDATWLTSDDTDQEDTHLWLRRETHARGIFVERHMKLDDPASPEHAGEISAEAKRLLESERARVQRSRQISQLVNKAGYHARRIRNDPEPQRHDFETINSVMEELRAMGVGPTDERVAEFRGSIAGAEFPADLPRHGHLGFEPSPTNTPAAGEGPGWSRRVAEARELLDGGRVVVVGGEPRPEAIARLEDAFAVTVDWVELTEHGSGARMQAPIQRPDTRLVLLLIKLTGHQHADEARDYAKAAGTPCINLVAGYNPNTVAEQILDQAGDRLGGDSV